jgi:hypothetical protein
MSEHPCGAHGKLQESELGVAGSESAVLDREPFMSDMAPGPPIPVIPGMEAISLPLAAAASGRHVKPLPTSVSWTSNRITSSAVARRKRSTTER